MTVNGGNWSRSGHRAITAIEGVDTDSVLTRLDAVTGEFRKAVLAGSAGGGTVPESTRMLACLAVCRLPVDMSG